MKTYSLQEVVVRISKATGIEEKLARNRFRHWVRLGFIRPVERFGTGTGTRRVYDEVAVGIGVILLKVNQFTDKTNLKEVALQLEIDLPKILQKLDNPEFRAGLILKESGTLSITTSMQPLPHDKSNNLNFPKLEKESSFLFMNLKTLLAKIKF
jgi:hypothetical protein